LDNVVSDWLAIKPKGQSNKPLRLKALQQDLGIENADVSAVRYQLLHRTASALREARRFSAHYAVALVQSFNEEKDKRSWQDLITFCSHMRCEPTQGRLVRVGS